MFKNYFKPTTKKIQKILLAAKAFIGTISIAAFFQGNSKAAFYFLISGAMLDFLLNCTKDDSADKTKPFNNEI